MVNEEALEKIEKLVKQYKVNWGIEPNLEPLYGVPRMSQEKLAAIMELIVETGDSPLVGWSKLIRQNSPIKFLL